MPCLPFHLQRPELERELSIAGEMQNICTEESRPPIKEENMIFHLCVEKSLCRETNLSIDRVRKNSRRAREYRYMVAYLILSIESDGENRTSFDLRELKPCAVSYQKLNK